MADLTLPTVAHRESQRYIGIPADVTLANFGSEIPKHFDELHAWAAERGVATGPEFIKYDVIDMENVLSVVFCLDTDASVEGDERVVAGEIPAGDYGTTTVTGSLDDVYDATAVLVGWAKERSIEWDAEDTPKGNAFASRIERYHSQPGAEQEIVEIAIKTR